MFLGVARITTRVVPGVSTFLGPTGRWLSAALMIVTLPVWAVLWGDYWLKRYAAFTNGWSARRVAALAYLILVPSVTGLAVEAMWVRKKLTRWTPAWPVEFPQILADKTTSTIAVENARRSPDRTASTASALMIGLALVTLVATLAAGIIKTFEGAVNDAFAGDYAITAQNNFSPIPIAAADAVADVPGSRRSGTSGRGRASPTASRSRSPRSTRARRGC